MHPRITSPRNPRVKEAVRLRTRRGRKSQQRTLIDGSREVLRAIEAGVDMLGLFVCEELLHLQESAQAVELARQQGIDLFPTTREVFGKLAFGERTEGVLAIARTPRPAWPADELPGGSVVVVLEHVEKPGNLGGVVRTADATGVKAVLVADTNVDLYSPNAIRASLGTVFSLPVISATGKAIVRWLRDREIAIFAARVDGAVDYTSVDYRGPVALVLGSEAKGLSSLWYGDDITSVALPMQGQADSLNLSVTAAVLMYEALRQNQLR